MNELICKLKTMFECFNQPDDKLTQTGRVQRDKLYKAIQELYHNINKNKKELKHNEIGMDYCPCCNYKIFLLEDGSWTHIIGKAFREASLRSKENNKN